MLLSLSLSQDDLAREALELLEVWHRGGRDARLGRMVGFLIIIYVLVKMTLDELKAYKSKILKIAQQRKMDNIRVFGSVAKGNNNPNSDIDFLVHMQPDADLLDLSGFKLDLEDLVGVDVVPDNSIHWSMKEQILSDAISLVE